MDDDEEDVFWEYVSEWAEEARAAERDALRLRKHLGECEVQDGPPSE